MKTLLISTDFSANAKHATEYGYNLAMQIKANIVLANAVNLPAEMPQAGMVTWPMEEDAVLINESKEELKKLKADLESEHIEQGYKPNISYINQTGVVADVVNEVVSDRGIDLIIMGTHGNNGLNEFLLGNHSRSMIDHTSKPLLLIPHTAQIGKIKKIAFATDFTHPEADLQSIYNLVPFAKALNADILITHVYDEKYQSFDFQKWLKQFLIDLSNKADYPHIYYRIIKNSSTDKGLGWLCEHGQVDMMAMVHRHHGFFDNLIKGSHTKRMADKISIPLLVIPSN